MGIIIKFILRNIREKKMRTLLIVFSIALASALTFASLAIGDTLAGMFMDSIKGEFGTANIYITSGEKSTSPYVSETLANKLGSKIDYAIGLNNGSATYKTLDKQSKQVSLKGVDPDEFQQMNAFKLTAIQSMDDFDANDIIINTITADKYKLKRGDSMKLDLNGTKHVFTVYAIAQPTGPFKEDGRNIAALIPKDTLGELNGVMGRVNTVYIKIAEGQDVKVIIEELKKIYGPARVEECITEEKILQQTSQISGPFLLMTFIVIFMSAFIVYTSFKVITMERLPIIGTFRSIGATRRTTDQVLMMESVAYGVFGGVFGVGLGFLILYGMSYALAVDPWTGMVSEIHLKYTTVQMIIAFSVAMILAIGSSFAPIVKVSKIPVKEIVLNNIEGNKGKKRSKWIYGIGLIVLVFTLLLTLPKNLLMPVGSVCLILSALAVTLIVPKFTTVMAGLIEPLFEKGFGNIGILAAKNLRDNKSIQNNIALLAVGISSIIMINTLSGSVATEVGKVYKSATFDVMMWLPDADRSTLQPILSTEGVENAYAYFEKYGVKIKGQDQGIDSLMSCDPKKQNEFWKFNLSDEDMLSMENGKNIMLSEMLRNTAKLKEGDRIILDTPTGDRTYTIIGFFDSGMGFAFTSEKNLKQDFKMKKYDSIVVRVNGDPLLVKEALEKKFAREYPWVETMKGMEEMNRKGNNQIFGIMKAFSAMAMLIGIFGILNNLLISFIQRKRHLAIFRSVGMSQKQIVRMMFVEAACGGLIGGTAGVGAGFLLNSILPFILKGLSAPLPIHNDPVLFMMALFAGVLITVVASISPALKSSKLNIIESIKFE